MTDAKTLLGEQKKSRIPKFIDADALPALTWSSGDALDADDIKRLIGCLRKEEQEKHDELSRTIAADLDPTSASAWSSSIHAQWSSNKSPSAHKWALFQMRILADKDALADLAESQNWGRMASNGGHARAGWYMDTFGAIDAERIIRVIYSQLSASSLGGTLQRKARELLTDMARASKMSPEDFLEARGILGAPPRKKLPFTPGEELTAGGVALEVNLHNGALIFREVETHKRHEDLPADTEGAIVDKVKQWREDIGELTMRWGTYFLNFASRGKTQTFAELREVILADPLASQLAGMLVWRTSSGALVRIESGLAAKERVNSKTASQQHQAFDVDYDPVSLTEDTGMSIQLLGDLPKAQRDRWIQHMVDEEIVMPVDILSREVYITTFRELDALEDPSDEWVESRLHEQGFSDGHPEDAGWIYENYKTYPDYNTRVFVYHSGFHPSGNDYGMGKGKVESMSFRDLFGNSRRPEDVHASVLAEACIELAKLKEQPTPQLFFS